MNNATLIGDVVISRNVLVLANAVLRGDFNQICIGENMFIQENSEDIEWTRRAVTGYTVTLENYRTELKEWRIRYTPRWFATRFMK